jgi:tyrosyl-tRNA synthetase
MPLITTASGAKFGKSESGAIWLDAGRTTPFEFYQFWLNTDDHDAVRYLKFFTFLEPAIIGDLERETASRPEARAAQRALAREVTRLVHGDDAVRDAESAAATLFAGEVSQKSVEELQRVFAHVPSLTLEASESGWPLVSVLVAVGAAASKGEATRLVRSGGIYVNDRRVQDEKAVLQASDAIEGQLFVVRRGKRDYFVLRVPRACA